MAFGKGRRKESEKDKVCMHAITRSSPSPYPGDALAQAAARNAHAALRLEAVDHRVEVVPEEVLSGQGSDPPSTSFF